MCVFLFCSLACSLHAKCVWLLPSNSTFSAYLTYEKWLYRIWRGLSKWISQNIMHEMRLRHALQFWALAFCARRQINQYSKKRGNQFFFHLSCLAKGATQAQMSHVFQLKVRSFVDATNKLKRHTHFWWFLSTFLWFLKECIKPFLK